MLIDICVRWAVERRQEGWAGHPGHLFRERGYDGGGIAELMAEASANGLARTASLAEALDVTEFVESYLSHEHRDGRGSSCTVAALGGDAARQPDDIKAQFAVGIESLATALQAGDDALPDTAPVLRAVRASRT